MKQREFVVFYKKLTKFENAKEYDIGPFKIKEPDYLSMHYFNSRSEQERFLKN